MKPHHPMQPIVLDNKGTPRFKRNAIVCHLLDSHPQADMNTLVLMPFSSEDRRQFAQLIGYSVSGYGELPYVNKAQCQAADAEAERVMAIIKARRSK